MSDINAGRMFVELGLEMSAFIDGLQAVEKEMRKRATAFLEIGTILTAAITAPLGAMLHTSLETYSEFQATMNKVSALGEVYGQNLEKLTAQAMDLGKKTIFSARQAAEGMTELAAAGFKTQSIYDAMPGVLRLASIEGMKMADAAKIAAAAINQFGFEAADMNKVADIMAKTSSSSATSVKTLGYSFQYIGSIAKSSNQSFLDISTALAVLGNAGRTGESAGTGLRAMLLSLEKPSKRAAELMESLGINVLGANGKLLPMQKLLAELQPLMTQVGAGVTVFGKRWSDVEPLLRGNAKAFEALYKEIAQFDGESKKMADTVRKGLKGTFEELKSNLEGLAIQMGKILEPVADAIMQFGLKLSKGISTALDVFAGLPAPIQAAVGAIVGFTAAIGPMLLGLGALLYSMASFSAAWPGIVALFEAGSIGAIGLTAGMYALAAAVAAVAVYDLVDQFKQTADAALLASGSTKTWTEILNEFGAQAAVAYDAISRFSGGMLPAIDNISELGKLGTWLTTVFNDIGKAIWAQLTDFRNYIGVLGDLSKMMQSLREIIEGFSGKYKEMFAGAEENLQRSLNAVRKAQAETIVEQNRARETAAAMSEANGRLAASYTLAAQKSRELAQQQRNHAEEQRRENQRQQQADNAMNARYAKQMADTLAFIKLAEKNLQLGKQLEAAALKTQTHFDNIFAKQSAGWKENLQQIEVNITLYDRLNNSVTKVWDSSRQVFYTWKELGMSNPLIKVLETNAKLDAAFKTLGVTSVKMFQDMRDKAKEAYDQIKAAFDAGNYNVSYKVVLEAYEKMLKAEIELSKVKGENWEGLKENIEQVNEELDELEGKPSKMTEEVNKLGKAIGDSFNKFTDGLIDAAIKGKDFGKVFKQLFTDLTQDVVNFVKSVLKGMLQDALKGNIDTLKDLGKTAKNTFKEVEKVFKGEVPGGGSTGGIPGASQDSMKATGGLANNITAVATAVSAVADVLMYLQGRRMEQDIGRIEVTTREIKAEIQNLRADEWTREKHLFALDKMAEATDRFGDAHGAYLSDILSNVHEIVLLLQSGAFAGGGGSGISPVWIEFGGSAKTATERFQELSDQTHLANQSLRETELQASTVAGYLAVTGGAADAVTDSMKAVRTAAQDLSEEFVAGTKEYAEAKDKMVKDESYNKWLQERLDMEKRAMRSMDRWGNTLDEMGNIVMYNTQYLEEMRKSVTGVVSATNGAMEMVNNNLVLGSDIARKAMEDAAAAADVVRASMEKAGRVMTSGGLGSALANIGATTDGGSNPAGSGGRLLLRNGQWVDPTTLLPPVTPTSNTTLNLNVNVNNANARTVANEMVGTWRTAGVPV